MTVKKIFVLYLLTVPVFFVIDMVWLGMVARGLYRRLLGDFISPRVNWTAAIVFYLIFIAGILIFAVLPALERGSLMHGMIMGALFGFFCYATYDLTNLATLEGWPVKIVVIDIVWGMVLCGSVALISTLIGRQLPAG